MAAALILGRGAEASTTGQIRGMVTDACGKPLGRVIVTLVGPATSGRPTTTDARGEFRFVHLSPGQYTVWTEEPGERAAWRRTTVQIGTVSKVTLTVDTAPPPADGPQGDSHSVAAPGEQARQQVRHARVLRGRSRL